MGSFVPQDYRNAKIKYTQKKLDMKIDYQQRYADAWEALYDQAILATPEYFDFTNLEKKVAPYEKAINEWIYGQLATTACHAIENGLFRLAQQLLCDVKFIFIIV